MQIAHPELFVGDGERNGSWDGVRGAVLQGILDIIARLREQGLDVIED